MVNIHVTFTMQQENAMASLQCINTLGPPLKPTLLGVLPGADFDSM